MKRRDFLRAVGAGSAMAAGVPAVAGMTQASAAAGVTADTARTATEILAAWRARERVALLRYAVLADSPTVRMSARQLLREADQVSAISDLMRGVV